MYKKILLSLITLYTVIGFTIVPMVLKSQIINIVSAKTNANLSIETIHFNPFAFKVEIIEAKLTDLNNSTLASFGSLQIDLEPHSLIKSALHVKKLALERPKVFLTYNEDRTFNFGKLLKESQEESVSKADKAQEGGELPRIVVDTLRVENGRLYYEEFTNKTKFEFEINDIAFKLTDIDTNDFNSSSASLRFNSALGDGGFVDFRSKIRGFNPLVVEGSVKFEASKLYSQWKYMQDKLKLEVADGKLSFGADYSLNFDDLNSTLIENMYVTVDKLRVKPKNKNSDILNLESFSATGISVKPMMQNVHVENISLSSLRAKVKRDADGEIDWIGYLSGEQALSDKKEQEEIEVKESTPWSVKVEKVALKKIGVEVEDRSVQPLVKTDLNELNIELKNLTLLGEEPLAYSMNLLLNNKATCSSSGSVKHKNLQIDSYIRCSDFDIVHYQPYIEQIATSELKKYNLALKSATAGFDARVSVKDINSTTNAIIDDASFALENLSLHKKDNGEKLANFKIFSLGGITLNTATKEVSIEKAALDNLDIDVKVNKDKSINLVGLVEPKEEKISAKRSSANSVKIAKSQEKPYRAKIDAFYINSAKVVLDDKSVANGVKTTIEGINLSAKNIDSKEKSWFSYALSLRVNNKGAVKSKGEIKHTPLEQRGSFELSKLSLKEFTPYIGEATYLKISDGVLNLKSKTAYKLKGQKHDATASGNLSVENFFLHDGRDGSTLVSFVKANLKSFSFSTIPSALYIDEILLDSFYLDAQIDENKRMNLAKLAKEKSVSDTPSPKEQSKEPKEDEQFSFKLLNFKVINGSANFADYSLPIDFKTHIHDLEGNVYAISNNKGEVSYADIDGAVDEYGSAKLKGSVESSDFKAFTDLSLNFRNLSLDSFSGYSAQFAGYKINKGKFFLDLEYKINNSQLLGKNSLVIRDIELGDEIEDDNITKLPLGFAIALLEDTEGVIDINMPVEGDLGKPDFKYGAMILKTFANIIVKAVTAPFRFLGEMMGIDGDDLKSVDFEASEFALLPPEREKLDHVAQMLLKKPKLSLVVTGSYDGIKDKKAIQSKKLTQEILKKSDNKNIVTVGILESICGEKLGRDRQKAIKMELEKKYKKELFKSEYQKELLLVCSDAQSVSPEELKELADKRAKTIREYLVLTKNIESSRVVLHEPKEISGAEEKWVENELKIEVR
ncbi:DUF748 domain-containing protein [Sulfurimonas sp.]|uniref:DUF748 domain-containing protein n=1 Tax=Sulfurimonas sp. TaxID=2022749 RepID=UPI0025F8BB38|nr:DUF748 domain-containing protein [Sulfurimonas sp.]MBW6489116.1 DUF748 domain-containing protein [Sulfurimonas sp.]